MTATQPRALLFDIGGVVSPFQAILDYEKSNGIPPGWINFSISRTAPNGTWHKLERGEILLDADFFKGFKRDLQQPHLWKEYQQRLRQKEGNSSSTDPPLPNIDAEFLFWEMMRVSREPDPFMFPALGKLKASGKYLMGALSNTVIYPPGHPFSEDKIGLRKQFDFFISSAHTGLRKPHPEIYAHALKTMNEVAAQRGQPPISASEIVFLDDIGENLKGAKKAGFGTIRVVLGKSQDAVKELENITGLQLLDGNDRPKL
ncbi:epoxide hydrolase [Talaromyces pinophilus]|uniref:Epoxide hydrolase n=1 Tax=Talaromyces pinophilus TaxID=128442 RepID=A0A478EDK9_TALPI|nr:epoxide hydrolase [Talaromyces pinophilus]